MNKFLLLEKIQKKHLTAATFGRSLGLSRQATYNLLNNRKRASPVLAAQIVRLLELTKEDFLKIFFEDVDFKN